MIAEKQNLMFKWSARLLTYLALGFSLVKVYKATSLPETIIGICCILVAILIIVKIEKKSKKIYEPKNPEWRGTAPDLGDMRKEKIKENP